MTLMEAHRFKNSARLAMQSAGVAAHYAKGDKKVEADAKLVAARKAYQKASDRYDEIRNKENAQ